MSMPAHQAKACCRAVKAGNIGVIEALEIDATRWLVAYSDDPEQWNAIFQSAELRVSLKQKRRIPLTEPSGTTLGRGELSNNAPNEVDSPCVPVKSLTASFAFVVAVVGFAFLVSRLFELNGKS